VKFRFFIFFAILFSLGNQLTASAQVESVIGQITSSTAESFVGGLSGDGRFAVIESTGNIATENPRNADGNREVFLFDYAQRRIFQITNTRSLLKDQAASPIFSNIRVEILSTRPVISHGTDENGFRWIAFSSNATTSTPAVPNTTNPGNFDANSFNVTSGGTTTNPLTSDGNTEMWLYRIPQTPAANLSSGDEIAFTDLSAGVFTRVTNTLPSRLPVEGSTSSLPLIANDNRDASLNSDGRAIAFVSNRDLVPCVTTPTATCGNAFPNFDNSEIYSYVRSSGVTSQVTATPRGTILQPIYNLNPTISGSGTRVAFVSNANNPIVGQTTGVNTDLSDEIFYSDLDAGSGAPTGARVQVTQTTAANQGDIVNIFSYGPRMSRDGRFIAFESFADLTGENNGANLNAAAVFVFDASPPATNPPTPAFRRVGPRANADPGSTGDVLRFPTFTDYNAGGTPTSLVLATRLNITSTGTIPATASAGLNPDASRPTQIYSFRLLADPNVEPSITVGTFTRLTRLSPGSAAASVQPYASNSQRRIVFSMAQVEPGTGNLDLQTESFYLLTPVVNVTTPANLSFATGASLIPVSPSPVPSPSPTASPTPTATPTPTGSPMPTPSPTPQTPTAVQGLAPGMLAIVNIDSGIIEPVTPKTAVGSVSRSFPLPIELSGVTMTINGAACGLKMVSRRQIVFTVPKGVFPLTGAEVSRPVVINNNGTLLRGNVTIVLARPDIFRSDLVPAPGGRAFLQNVINRVPTTEPFNVTTVRQRGGVRVATVLRLYATGILIPNAGAVTYSVRIGNVTVNLPSTLAVEREPGIFTLDFTLPSTLVGAGDQPVVLTMVVGGQTFTSRLDDTAPRTRIL
jgi:uncharacterized protein (TIGR03437 family)